MALHTQQFPREISSGLSAGLRETLRSGIPK